MPGRDPVGDGAGDPNVAAPNWDAHAWEDPVPRIRRSHDGGLGVLQRHGRAHRCTSTSGCSASSTGSPINVVEVDPTMDHGESMAAASRSCRGPCHSAEPWENGWKDTVIFAYRERSPRRRRMRFDNPASTSGTRPSSSRGQRDDAPVPHRSGAAWAAYAARHGGMRMPPHRIQPAKVTTASPPETGRMADQPWANELACREWTVGPRCCARTIRSLGVRVRIGPEDSQWSSPGSSTTVRLAAARAPSP